MKEIFTIGYAGFELAELVSVLQAYGVNSLIDVRSSPYSKYYSDYNIDNLRTELNKMNIAYRNYKSEFGARQTEKQYYPNGYMDFSLFTRSEAFRSGLDRLCNACGLGYRFVLMCSEKDPVDCHRAIMVAREFYNIGYDIKHILPDGGIMTQAQIERRLVDMYYPDSDQLSLLDNALSWEEMVSNSYAFQNRKIGYRLDGR